MLNRKSKRIFTIILAQIALVLSCGIAAKQTIKEKEKPQKENIKPFELNFFPLKVGSKLSAEIFISPIIMEEKPKAFLFLTIADIDAAEEIEIFVNGKGPLPTPDDLVDDSLRRSAELSFPIEWLKNGKNKITFRFADNLDGSTGGFIVYDVKILVKY